MRGVHWRRNTTQYVSARVPKKHNDHEEKTLFPSTKFTLRRSARRLRLSAAILQQQQQRCSLTRGAARLNQSSPPPSATPARAGVIVGTRRKLAAANYRCLSPPTRITRPITSARSSPQYRPGSGLQPLPPLPDSSGNVQSSRSHPPTAPGHASGCASGAQLTPQSGISETPQSGIFQNPSIYIPPLATELMLLFSNLCGIVMSTGSDAL